jgi:hypothetical protein
MSDWKALSYGGNSSYSLRDPRADFWGKEAEKAVRAALIRMGERVIPQHLIQDGGAPMAVSYLGKWVLPDFLVAKEGAPRWIEVKFKTCPGLYQKITKWRHGVDLPNWNDYLAVQKEFGIPGWIVVLQYKPGPHADPDPCLLTQSLDILKTMVQIVSEPTRSAPRGMAYWNVDDMEVMLHPMNFNFTDVPLLERKLHPWVEKSRQGKAPRVDIRAPKQLKLL